nr:uncharacterized protein LOC129254008 [Lytechinus pictus]
MVRKSRMMLLSEVSLKLHRSEVEFLQRKFAQESDAKSEEIKEKARLLRSTSSSESSFEYDISALLNDLQESTERERDLQNQLQLVEEESDVIRKNLNEVEQEKEALEFELERFKMRFGTLEEPKRAADSGKGVASEKEAELRLQLMLAEQEATVMRRKLVELEAKNEELEGALARLSERIPDDDDIAPLPQRQGPVGEEAGPKSTSHSESSSNAEIEALRRHVEELMQENDGLRTKVEMLDEVDAEYRINPDEHIRGEPELRTKLHQAERAITTLKKRLVESEYEGRTFQMEAESLRKLAHIAGAEGGGGHAKHRGKSLETKLRAQVSLLNTEADAMRRQIVTLEIQNEQLQDELEKQMQTPVAVATSSSSDSDRERLEALQQKIAQLEEELGAYYARETAGVDAMSPRVQRKPPLGGNSKGPGVEVPVSPVAPQPEGKIVQGIGDKGKDSTKAPVSPVSPRSEGKPFLVAGGTSKVVENPKIPISPRNDGKPNFSIAGKMKGSEATLSLKIEPLGVPKCDNPVSQRERKPLVRTDTPFSGDLPEDPLKSKFSNKLPSNKKGLSNIKEGKTFGTPKSPIVEKGAQNGKSLIEAEDSNNNSNAIHSNSAGPPNRKNNQTAQYGHGKKEFACTFLPKKNEKVPFKMKGNASDSSKSASDLENKKESVSSDKFDNTKKDQDKVTSEKQTGMDPSSKTGIKGSDDRGSESESDEPYVSVSARRNMWKGLVQKHKIQTGIKPGMGPGKTKPQIQLPPKVCEEKGNGQDTTKQTGPSSPHSTLNVPANPTTPSGKGDNKVSENTISPSSPGQNPFGQNPLGLKPKKSNAQRLW